MKQCTCYALRAVDCTCKPAKYGELYTSPTAKQEQSTKCVGEPEQQIVSLQCAHCQVTIETLNDKVMSLLAKQSDSVEQSAQHVGEPVAWMDRHFTCDLYKNKPELDVVPLYTTPPQRTWIGLTDKEVDECYESIMFHPDIEPTRMGIYLEIEAKLKEKNT